MQEVDLIHDYDEELLTFKGDTLFIRVNLIKARVGLVDKSNLRIGKNLIVNRLTQINSKIIYTSVKITPILQR